MYIGEPRYRICRDASGRHVIFFCDWEGYSREPSYFYGKPIYFEYVNGVFLPFFKKTIGSVDYIDMAKTNPGMNHLGDIALKLLAIHAVPGILFNNFGTPLQTLCMVKSDSVIAEIGCVSTCRHLEIDNSEFSKTCSLLMDILPSGCELGLVGSSALCNVIRDDLDFVVLADSVTILNKAKKVIDGLVDQNESEYVRNLWPLTRRTKYYGVIDFFYSLRTPNVVESLCSKQIDDPECEFEEVVADDNCGILGVPSWRLEDGRQLISIDNALRGRIWKGMHVCGIGLRIGSDIILENQNNIFYLGDKDMSKKKTIIIDIDNTILDQVPRKQAILLELGIPATFDEIKADFHLTGNLKKGTTNRAVFIKELYGDKFHDRVQPIIGAPECLNELKENYNITYLSSRPIVQYKITKEDLKKFGFPEVDEKSVQLKLWPIKDDIGSMAESQIIEDTFQWKKHFLSNCAVGNSVLFHINDRPEEVALSACVGIPSAVFSPNGADEVLARKVLAENVHDKFISESIIFVRDWNQVEALVSSADSAEDKLGEMVSLHTREYASFLSDLDAKSRIQLIVSTFIGTGFIAIAWRSFDLIPLNKIVWWLSRGIQVLSILGLMSCFLSMLFSIRAFGSRHTRGNNVGSIVKEKIKFFKTFFPVLIGIHVAPPNSPIFEADEVRAGSNSAAKRLVHFAFFQRHYGTYDPDLIRNQRMLDMRALNYEKIIPEIFSRRMLLIGIGIAGLSFFLIALIECFK